MECSAGGGALTNMAILVKQGTADRTPNGGHTSSRDRRVAAVVAASVVPFLGVLGGELVWDDHMLTDGSAIGGGKSLLNCFTQPFLWHFFRPLVSVSFFFERMLWRGDPLGYHITNLLIHGAGAFVMFLLLLAAFRSRSTALIGALLFGVHPVQVGPTAWIGGRTDSLATLWVLLFMWQLVTAARNEPGTSGRHLGCATLFFNLAIYTKEQTLPLLVLVPFAFRVWKPSTGVRLPRTGLYATLPFVVSAALFLGAGYFLGMPRPSPLPYSIPEIAVMAGETVHYYALMLLAPAPAWMHRLSLEEFSSAGHWPALTGWSLSAGYVLLLFLTARRSPASAWFLGAVGLTLLPVTNLLPLPFLVIAPYRAAIPWIGLAAVLGHVFGKALDAEGSRLRTGSRTIKVFTPILAGLLVWYTLLSAWGSLQWRRETRLFEQITRYDPVSLVAKTVYTYSLEREGRFMDAARIQAEALDQLFGSPAWREWETADRAIRSDPDVSFRARRNQGTTEDPRIWITSLYAQLANCLQRAGDHPAARKYLSIGDRIWPNHVRIHLGMGHYALEDGRFAEAVRRYRMALSIHPDSIPALSGLGRGFAGMEQWQESVDTYARASRLEPGNLDLQNRLNEAISNLRRSLAP